MRAVAHVIVNRVGPRFGDSLTEVILHPKQFSAWNEGDPNRPLAQNPERYARSGINRETWETAQEVAREVLDGRSTDPTAGALFYHTSAISPYWAKNGVGEQVIGHHVFYSDVTPRAG
ncbi:MAG: cell wall hydrolase [Terricaulis sp.]